jgi:hypothetical protein
MRSGAFARAFHSAEPFKHVAIDGFFKAAFAEALLANFPAFNPALAKNEIYGGVWGKAVNENIRTIGPVYQDLYELVASREFLDLIGDITGIPDLLIDPKYYGGGTHENLQRTGSGPSCRFQLRRGPEAASPIEPDCVFE